MIDKYNINPAYAGLDRSLSVNFNYRNQWQGFNGNPNQFYINGHLPLYIINGGAGFKMYSDNLGLITTTGISFSYNYVYPIQGGVISTGGSLGIRQNSVNGSEIITPDGIYDDGTFSHEDPILDINTMNGISPDWTIGVFVGHDYFDLGLSISNYTFATSDLGNFEFKNSRNINLYSQFPFLIEDFEIYPSFLLKTNFNTIQGDVSVMIKNGNIFGGTSLRGYSEKSLDSIIFFGGLRLSEHYTLSYSYDVGLSAVRQVSQGSHEINLNYNLNKRINLGLPPDIIYNPRNL